MSNDQLAMSNYQLSVISKQLVIGNRVTGLQGFKVKGIGSKK
jgi:hypothetical protein